MLWGARLLWRISEDLGGSLLSHLRTMVAASRAFRSIALLISLSSCAGFLLAGAPSTPVQRRERRAGGVVAAHGELRASIIGIGAAAPERRVPNSELEKVVDTSDEWISQRTGISCRHLIAPDQGLADLASKAAKEALEHAGVDPLEVGLVIMATSSPDDLFGDAAFVARSVGATNAVAFDLTAACSGFLFGINTASQFLHNGAYKTAIVIGADALSRWVDWTDRNTCVLFGDGAGAVVLQQTAAGQPAGILGYEMHSNGAGRSDLNLGYNGESKDLGTTIPATVTKGAYTPIAMNGKEVYKFATTCVPEVLKEALDNAGLTADDVDWLLLHQVRAVAHQRARAHSTSSISLPCAPNDCLPHRIPRLPSLWRVFTPSRLSCTGSFLWCHSQANIRIMETVAKKLGIPMEKVITNLAEYGNTSAGSIPLALNEAVKAGKVKPGDVIACAGFGAGLSWGSAIIRWSGK